MTALRLRTFVLLCFAASLALFSIVVTLKHDAFRYRTLGIQYAQLADYTLSLMDTRDNLAN